MKFNLCYEEVAKKNSMLVAKDKEFRELEALYKPVEAKLAEAHAELTDTQFKCKMAEN